MRCSPETVMVGSSISIILRLGTSTRSCGVMPCSETARLLHTLRLGDDLFKPLRRNRAEAQLIERRRFDLEVHRDVPHQEKQHTCTTTYRPELSCYFQSAHDTRQHPPDKLPTPIPHLGSPYCSFGTVAITKRSAPAVFDMSITSTSLSIDRSLSTRRTMIGIPTSSTFGLSWAPSSSLFTDYHSNIPPHPSQRI